MCVYVKYKCKKRGIIGERRDVNESRGGFKESKGKEVIGKEEGRSGGIKELIWGSRNRLMSGVSKM